MQRLINNIAYLKETLLGANYLSQYHEFAIPVNVTRCYLVDKQTMYHVRKVSSAAYHTLDISSGDSLSVLANLPLGAALNVNSLTQANQTDTDKPAVRWTSAFSRTQTKNYSSSTAIAANEFSIFIFLGGSCWAKICGY
jgi:hypothetical protein